MDRGAYMKRKRFIKILIVVITMFMLLGLLILVGTSFLSSHPKDDLDTLLTLAVEETSDAYIIYAEEPVANLVFYPGGLVEAESYLYLADLLAQEGVNVWITKMPLNLAILNRFAFLDVYEDNDLPWFIAGHSLGGASATYVVDEHDDLLEGLILLAAYPPSSVDLSSKEKPVLSITASRDGVIDLEAFEDRKALLPSDTIYREIDGGNHAFFGYYGSQRGDNAASITVHEQHQETVSVIIAFIKDVIES